MSTRLPPNGWPYTKPNGEKRVSWCDDKKRTDFERMWRDDVDVEEMADFFECSTGTIYSKASQWKLGRRRPLGGPRKNRTRVHGAAPAKRRKKRVWKRDTTGQRRKAGFTDGAGPRVVLEPHHPASREGATIFPTMVIPARRRPRMLISGMNSAKIGTVATKGRWAGMRLYTLTLEERETCPRSCLEWARCYGNNMPFADRIADDGTLTTRLWGELAALNAEFPGGFIVRLHVLGDFYSTAYVDFWRRALADFPALRVFGFTARRPPDPIGNALVLLAADEQDRFVMRFSGAGYETHSSEVVETAESPMMGIRCPAELKSSRCCATCGLCWTSTRTITFVAH